MNTPLDLDLIRTFLTVVALGGLKHAAQKLNKTPSAISMQIKKLENELGHRLLDRNNKGISLTEAGQTLKKHGEKLILANNTLLAELRGDELKGIYTFGAPTDYGPTLLQKLLPLLRNEFPMIKPKIILEPSRILRQRVKAKEIDIAIVSREIHSTEGTLLWREPINWYGVDNNDSKPTPVATLSIDCVLRDITLNALAQWKAEHEIVLESTTVVSLKDAVNVAFSMALLPSSLADQFDKSHIPTVSPPTEIKDLEFALITSTGFDNQNKERLEQKLTASLLTINH